MLITYFCHFVTAKLQETYLMYYGNEIEIDKIYKKKKKKKKHEQNPSTVRKRTHDVDLFRNRLTLLFQKVKVSKMQGLLLSNCVKRSLT